MSIVPSLLRQQSFVSKVRVPVLVACGTKDALYSPLGCRSQKDRFTRSRSTTLRFVRNAGHAVTLDRPAADFRRNSSRRSSSLLTVLELTLISWASGRQALREAAALSLYVRLATADAQGCKQIPV